MPRIRVEDYEDFEDDQNLNIEDDDPPTEQRVPTKPPKQDLDWEERRRRMQRQRGTKDFD